MLTGGIASTLNVGFCDEAAVAVALRYEIVQKLCYEFNDSMSISSCFKDQL